MDSIRDSLQAWKHRSDQANGEAADLFKALLEEPLVKQFQQKHQDLQHDELRRHAPSIAQMVSDRNHCDHCPGLEKCPNPQQGHYTGLVMESEQEDRRLYATQTPCHLYKSSEYEQRIRKRIRSFYVDDRTLQDSDATEEEMLSIDSLRSKAVYQVIDYVQLTQEKGLQRQGLYFEGPFGTGKTFLACYVLRELAKSGHQGIIVYVPDFAEDLKGMMHEAGRIQETIELMKETDVLVFDDIGAENLSPWMRDHVLGAILNYRMDRKPTLYTSNYDLKALQQHFSFTTRDGEESHKGERLMDRVSPYVQLIKVDGINKRHISKA